MTADRAAAPLREAAHHRRGLPRSTVTASPPRSLPTRAATTAAATSRFEDEAEDARIDVHETTLAIRAAPQDRPPPTQHRCMHPPLRADVPSFPCARGRRRSTTDAVPAPVERAPRACDQEPGKSWAKESDDAEPDPRASAAAKAPAAPTKKPSKLASCRPRQARPSARCMFYGPEGVGKSSLAVDAGAIFLNIEDGLSGRCRPLHVPRGRRARRCIANTLEEVYEAIDDLAERHDYAAVAIDTVDALESRLLWPKVCKDHDEPTIESRLRQGATPSPGRRLLTRLSRLRERGMDDHPRALDRQSFKNPEGEDYDRYQLKLHDKAAGSSRSGARSSASSGSGGRCQDPGRQGDQQARRGWHTGRRIMHLSRTAAWDANFALAAGRNRAGPHSTRGRCSATRATRPTTRPTPRSAPPSAPSWLG